MPYRLNMDKAKALLAEAGHPNGGFTIDCFCNTGDEEKRLIGVGFQSQAQKLGIRVNLHVTPWPTLISKAVAGRRSTYGSPEVDRLVDRAVAAPGEKAATALYERAARIIVDRATT